MNEAEDKSSVDFQKQPAFVRRKGSPYPEKHTDERSTRSRSISSSASTYISSHDSTHKADSLSNGRARSETAPEFALSTR